MASSTLNYLSAFFTDTLGFNLASSLFGVLVFIWTVITYYRSKRVKIPTYAIRTANLVKENFDKVSEIKIAFKDIQVNSLSVSRIALWNAGKETINNSDIPDLDRLRISVTDEAVKILDANIIYQKNSTNNFGLGLGNIQNGEIYVNFDYFDYDEGVVIQIFHTGRSGGHLSMNGTVKGVGRIQKVNNRPFPKINTFFGSIDKKIKRKYKRWLAVTILITTPILFVIEEFIPKPDSGNVLLNKYLPIGFLTCVYWYMAYVIHRARPPSDFELFEEDITAF